MLLASGANFGWIRTLPHMLGVSLGHMLMVVLVGVGLIQIFETFPITNMILKVASIAFLLYLSYKIATAAPPAETSETPTGKPLTFIQAALFQWVNPKAWAMALTAISAYTPENSGTWGVMIVAMVFATTNFPSINLWVFLGTQLRRLLNVPWKLRAFNFGAALLLLASLYPILFATV
ncbi:MAG: LysE family translocator [Sneathiella sp.]|nr:LysE family translocator [Sneathiella sp.]